MKIIMKMTIIMRMKVMTMTVMMAILACIYIMLEITENMFFTAPPSLPWGAWSS